MAPSVELSAFRGRGGAWVRVILGDITAETVDAIVNAANESLRLGGGVAGAIGQAGGPSIQVECDAWLAEHGPVETGSAAITGAGALSVRHVIHAVGPVWGSGDEDRKLKSAVLSALALARIHGLKTVSLPAISSGIYGFPTDRCAGLLVAAADAFEGLEEIRLCNIDEPTAADFAAEAERFRSQTRTNYEAGSKAES